MFSFICVLLVRVPTFTVAFQCVGYQIKRLTDENTGYVVA
jgi:hypothetical protein